MSLPALLNALRGLLADTLAQARAAGLSLAAVTLTLICALFCLSIGVSGDTPSLPTQPWENADLIPRAEADRIKMSPADVRAEGVDVPTGEMTLLFGSVRIPLQRTVDHAVRMIQIILAGGLADTAGVLLALLWTASFLPSFLEPAGASVMLVKPVPRWSLIIGKFTGVITAVLLQAAAFVLITWLCLGIRTGTWDVRYFLAIPILLLHFGVFFSISAALAVVTRSAVACALGTIGAWILCCGVNYTRHAEVLADSAGHAHIALETAYWVLPKPIDYNLILAESLNAGEYFRTAIDAERLSALGRFSPELSLLSGIVFAVVVLMMAAWRFSRQDY